MELDRPRGDEHWEALRADDRVREMLGIIDAGGLSREEGWRADVRFFAREIKRRACAPFRDICEPDFDAAGRSIRSYSGRLDFVQVRRREGLRVAMRRNPMSDTADPQGKGPDPQGDDRSEIQEENREEAHQRNPDLHGEALDAAEGDEEGVSRGGGG